MAPDEVGHRIGPIVLGIEARHEVEVLAAVLLEGDHVVEAEVEKSQSVPQHFVRWASWGSENDAIDAA